MKLIDNLLSKYAKFREKRRSLAKEIDLREEEKKKNYYLSNYGAYKNADKLTHEEILEVFWKILKEAGYDPSKFNSNTSVREPAKQLSDWDDLGSIGFLTVIDRMFDFSNFDITDDEYDQVKNFGELADLVIKKAREKMNPKNH